MGTEGDRSGEMPPHAQEVASFCLDVTEVTVSAYQTCSTCTAPRAGSYCNWGVKGRESHPINCVDWNQAQGYCAAVGKRLPTEAEWEYGARGGRQELMYPWGSAEPGNRACWNGEGNDLRGKRRSTCPVASHPAEAFGLRDMAGNVREWIADWYGHYPDSGRQGYAGPPSPTERWGSSRVVRGGTWSFSLSWNLRGADRTRYEPGYQDGLIGFRCASSSGQ